jgi:hypothetical protein
VRKDIAVLSRFIVKPVRTGVTSVRKEYRTSRLEAKVVFENETMATHINRRTNQDIPILVKRRTP